jgi:serine/threonine-protein kinase RsbW
MGSEFELCVASELSKLAEIADFVTEAAARAGLDENQVFEVQMATDEACTNSMEHAYEGREDGEVHVCCSIEDNAFVVRVTDFGRPFTPEKVPVPDVTLPMEERAVGGLGLFLMRRLVDDVQFAHDPVAGNQVTLRKRRKNVAGGASVA